jgi:hypothetical protein
MVLDGLNLVLLWLRRAAVVQCRPRQRLRDAELERSCSSSARLVSMIPPLLRPWFDLLQSSLAG